jgi:chromosomal replication initiation ATPase DnaA
MVSEVFEVNREEILDRWSCRHSARKVAIYFCQRYTGLSNEAIGRLFGGIHYSAVSKVTNRIKEEMLKDKGLSELVDKVNSHFKA